MQDEGWQRYLKDQYVKLAVALLVVFVLAPNKFTGRTREGPWWIWLVLLVVVAALIVAGIRRTNRK